MENKELKAFVLKHFKRAVIGCAEWAEHSDIMHDHYFYRVDAYSDMLLELGYTYHNIMCLKSHILQQYYRTHV